MKTKADLKAALDALQVKKPLRLPSSAPTFVPPSPSVAPLDPRTQVLVATSVAEGTPVSLQTQVGADTSVDAETEVLVETRVAASTPVPVQTEVGSVGTENHAEVSTLVSAETRVPPSTPVRVETQVVVPASVPEQTQVPVLAQVAARTSVPGNAQVAPGTQVPRQTLVSTSTEASEVDGASANRAGHQDSSVVMESQAAPKLHHGYTRLPNSILMRIVGGELQRSEVQILLLIARFTISFQRRHAPLSKAVLERQTGLRGPAVLQAIADLIAKGLVEKIPGDQYRPNLLGLRFDDDWDFFDKPGRLTNDGTPVPAGTQVAPATPVSSPDSALVPAPTPAGVPVETYFKDNKTIVNNNSLSSLPASLQDYFSTLKPERKRESEWKAFESLISDYAVHDVADCLSEIQSRGVHVIRDGSEATERCHSPMAFLSKAIGAVLEEIHSKREKVRERAEREQRDIQEQLQRRLIEAREGEEWAVKEEAFRKAFPGDDREREVISELCRNMPFRPHTEVGRIFAVGKWWDGLKESERQGFL